MYVRVEYPSHAEELQILDLDHQRQKAPLPPPRSLLSQDTLFALRDAAAATFLDQKLNRYIVDLVQASRQPGSYDPDLARWCRFGASRAPRSRSRAAPAPARGSTASVSSPRSTSVRSRPRSCATASC